jgi:hypothetical protein
MAESALKVGGKPRRLRRVTDGLLGRSDRRGRAPRVTAPLVLS